MRKWIRFSILFIVIPLVIFLGVVVFDERQYALISMALAFLACLPFFLSFEDRKVESKELAVIVAIVSINVIARIAFVWIPHFKPVTAMVIIAGVAFGKNAGFMVGALTAVLSNMYFGQGPWTPFQMFAWGIIGYFAGLFQTKLFFHKKIFLIAYATVAAVLFSVLMEVWTVLAFQEGWNFTRFYALLATSSPVVLAYILSTILFIGLFYHPFMAKFERLKSKYGLFVYKNNSE